MTDDRIIDIFEQHGQFVTGKDYALIRTIAEAVAAQRTWVGLTLEDKQRILANDFGGNRLDCMDAAERILKEKNNGN